MSEQVKYGARPSQVSKTAAGQPGKKDVIPQTRPPEKDKKP
jgi:hypothetical protein